MDLNKKFIQSEKGQALTEMLIVIPLLFLMVAGMTQFSILFLARSAFEQSCGQAARKYAAGRLNNSNSFSDEVWANLENYQSYFRRETLVVVPAPTQSLVANSFLNNTGFLGPLISKIKSSLFNYSGQKWIVTIRYNSIPLFGTLFPAGIPFQTELAVLKYPDQE